MAPKKNPAATVPASSASTSSAIASTPVTTTKFQAQQLPKGQSVNSIAATVWQRYVEDTPQRVKLIDAFLGFLMVVGALQFIYVCAVGNYPFNAFLSGFSASVGQFVLTVSLRIQTTQANRTEFESAFSDERAFADYVFGSLILHFFCVNFIN